MHHPPHFDDILNVAEADKTLAKHKQLLSGLYLVDAGPTSRTTPEALGELIRTLFSGFVAEPLPMNRWIRQALATVLEKNRKASVPDEVWQWRIEQYLIHRYLVFFPEEQRLINLPMILSLGHRYLPLPPLLSLKRS